MKFKIDENLPIKAATTLREAGFDAEWVRDTAPSGASGATIEDRVRQAQDKPTVVTYVRKFIALLPERSPAGELWIVQHDRIRFRRSGTE